MRESGETTIGEAVEEMMLAVQARIAREAEAAGLTVDAYEDRLREEERERQELDREAALRAQRAKRLEKIRPHLTDAGYRLLVAGQPPRMTPALRTVQRWCDAGPDAPAFLVLTGGTGCGKTFAAAMAMSRFSRSVEYVRASHLAARYEPFSGDRERDIEPLRMSAGLMVLDDIGTERRSADGRRDPRFMPALSDVIDSRQQLGTIITTNLSKQAFLETYADPRMASRLEQSGYFHGCGNDDLRRAGR